MSRMSAKYCNQLNGPLVNIVCKEAAVAALERSVQSISSTALDTFKAAEATEKGHEDSRLDENEACQLQ